MCGRLAFTETNKTKIAQRFHLMKMPDQIAARYNIAPTQSLAVVLNESPAVLSFVRWGLVPHWSKGIDAKYTMINARADTIFTKPAFRGPIRQRRCLILADSFFEWQQTSQGKQPFRFFQENGELFAMAGVWDVWEKSDQRIVSCSIITTQANAVMRLVHDRMPVILEKNQEQRWLQSIESKEIEPLLAPSDNSHLQCYPISTLVNSATNDFAEILQPLHKS